MDDIHSLSEEDIKLRYITPAILAKGWSVQDITMERSTLEETSWLEIKPSLLISVSSPKKRKRYCAQMNS